jgi:site-specific DNA-cytosine methylase
MEEKGYRFYNQAWETIKDNDCKSGDIVDAFNKKINDSGISPTITTRPEGFKTAILLVDALQQDKEIIVVDDYNGCVKADQSSVGTLTRNCGNDAIRNGIKIVEKEAVRQQDIAQYRIRKLTERECGRLMGVKDDDISKIGKNLSRSAQYHTFGDSIVTACLMAIFGKMFNVDYESKIKELTKNLTGEG